MLFRKDIEPRCAYCAQGVRMKRVPPRPAQLSTDGLKEEDFSL